MISEMGFEMFYLGICNHNQLEMHLPEHAIFHFDCCVGIVQHDKLS